MAYDVFLKLDGIPGESSDEKHKEWIELSSINWGVDQPVSVASASGGRTGGKADFGPLMLAKQTDKSSPDLFQHCANGKHIAEAKIEFCEAAEDKHTFLTCTLKDVTISQFSFNGTSDAMSKPEESVGLAYGEVKWKYHGLDQSGKPGPSSERGWNLEENKKV